VCQIKKPVELEPRSVDIIVRRWQDCTGKQAVREANGVAFDHLTAQRGAE